LRKAVNFSPVCLPSSSITTAWPNAFSVRPSLALTRSELPSSETGGLVSPLAGFMHGVLARKAGKRASGFSPGQSKIGNCLIGNLGPAVRHFPIFEGRSEVRKMPRKRQTTPAFRLCCDTAFLSTRSADSCGPGRRRRTLICARLDQRRLSPRLRGLHLLPARCAHARLVDAHPPQQRTSSRHSPIGTLMMPWLLSFSPVTMNRMLVRSQLIH
jgi:hypothetical protein